MRLSARLYRLTTRLHAKVSLGVIIPLLAVLAVFTILSYQRQRDATFNELSTLASYTGRIVESDLRHQMMARDFEGLQNLLDTVAREDEIRTIYLLDRSGQVIFAPGKRDVGLRLDNSQEDCQPCHSLPPSQRPDRVMVTTPSGESVFRAMAPIENTEACSGCHDENEALIGVLLIDISVAPFSERLRTHLTENILLWFSAAAITLLVVYLVVNRLVLSRLSALSTAFARMSGGTPPPDLEEGSQDEIGQLVRSFNVMKGQIEQRTAENRTLSQRLQEQSEQRGELLERLITAQENERIRVARELHDELGQSMTGLALRAEALAAHVPNEDSRGSAILAQIRNLVAGTTEQIYDIIMALRPSLLDDMGLVSALNAYAERALERSNITFTIDDSCFENRLPPEVETTLFRVFQEGINNTVRHADASHLQIALTCRNAHVEGELRDDGKGFELEQIARNGSGGRGFGLLGMHERISQCGGEMKIQSDLGRGTRIWVSIPLPEVNHATEY